VNNIRCALLGHDDAEFFAGKTLTEQLPEISMPFTTRNFPLPGQDLTHQVLLRQLYILQLKTIIILLPHRLLDKEPYLEHKRVSNITALLLSLGTFNLNNIVIIK
jgi:hypothetical protein